MPECDRCARMLASCELRRLPSGGWRCKSAGKGTRCAQLAGELRAAERQRACEERALGHAPESAQERTAPVEPRQLTLELDAATSGRRPEWA